MEKFAYYLPQYHTIHENDIWWGKGFTEWTNVKSAVPLFKNHIQPKIPKDDNYYSLKDKNTLIWQSNLAKEYSIDGMIFYHYYFSGKKLLEKPAELLLSEVNIPLNFFFCWANHDWNRSWNGSKEILIKQSYGNEDIWEVHFQYLLLFFKDTRYKKENNKPLFMLYDSNFEEKSRMISFFDRRCKENGFDGILTFERSYSYKKKDIVKAFSTANNSTNYIYLREPEASGSIYLNLLINLHINLKVLAKRYFPKIQFYKIIKYNGSKIFKIMTRKKLPLNIIRGCFFEWDNTPRHKKRGYIITPPSKKDFMSYMDSVKESKYLFFNAWNEWSEGMMLEPSKENGYRYLEWIKEWSILNL
jgi:hypothetical protein